MAGFLGGPGANLVQARIEVGARTVQVRVGDGAGPCELATGPVRRIDGRDVTVAVRPEHLRVGVAEPAHGVTGTARHSSHLGGRTLCHVQLRDATEIVVANVSPHGKLPGPGGQVSVTAAPSRLRLFDRTCRRDVC